MYHSTSADPAYNLALVLISFAIAALDIYAALKLIKRGAALRRYSRVAWLGCAVALLGSGVGAALASTADSVIEAAMRGVAVSLATLGLTLTVALVERHLVAQTAAFESLFMHHPDAVYALSLEGVIKSVNPAAAAMTGYQANELTGIPFVTPIAAEARSQVLYALFLAAKGTAHSYETTLIHRSGRHLTVSITNVPIVTDGRITGMYGLMKDITERTRVEHERARMIAILEATTDLIGTANPAGDIHYCNQASRTLLGWSKQDAVECHSLDELFAPHTRAFLRDEAIPTALRAGVWSGDSVVLSAEGREIPVSLLILAHYNDDGSTAFLSTIARDMTDRVEAEATLQAERTLLEQRVVARTAELQQANAELARAARLKDEFLASVSHELRTPLNAVLGLSESLHEGVYGPINSEQQSTLHGIIESGHHLLSLINDILELSKIEAGKATLHYDDVAIAELCEASLRIVRQQAIQKRLTLSLTTDQALVSISADQRRLKQILVNLLSNAVKFTPEGGKIGLEVDADAARGVVQFSVWDSGIGIAAEDLARLFQPFIQLDSGLARQYAGTGLGLALVNSMVKLHGGTIAVESAVGHGSKFCVTLPWKMPAEHPSDQAPDTLPALWSASARRQPAPPTTIMLAEDNELNIVAFVDYLTANGYRVIVARNGLEALARLVSCPDLILMDIQMPEMDGLEAMRLMRSDERHRHTPIIALTALAMPGDEARCLAAGANAYLSKPVSLHKMTELIAAHLQQRITSKEHIHAQHHSHR